MPCQDTRCSQSKNQVEVTDEIRPILVKPDVTYSIEKDDSDTLACLSFTTEQQKQHAALYGDVVLVDATYQINKYQMPLYTLAVVDHEGHGQLIAHGLLAREDAAHVGLFLKQVGAWLPNLADAIFIVDKNFAKITAIQQTFDNATIHLCRFHIPKAFAAEMKQQGCANDRQLY